MFPQRIVHYEILIQKGKYQFYFASRETEAYKRAGICQWQTAE